MTLKELGESNRRIEQSSQVAASRMIPIIAANNQQLMDSLPKWPMPKTLEKFAKEVQGINK